MLDVGLLLLRVVVGLLLVGHGLQKLTGWFGGPGREGNARFLASLGYRNTHGLTWVHGLAETIGGLLIAVGLLLPLAAAAVIAVMVNAAVAVHAPKGLWSQNGGYEYPLVLGVSSAALALTGGGRFALEALIGWAPTAEWSIAGIGAGVILGILALWWARTPEAATERSQQRPGSPAPAA